MIIIYDVEVYKYDWLVGFKFYDGPNEGKYVHIHNDLQALDDFYAKYSKDELFVGFNNVYYDDKIIGAILKGKDPYKVSVDIIENDKRNIWFKVPYTSFDLLQDLFGQKPGLKLVEYNEGMSIEEIPFTDYEAKLTPEALQTLIDYNIHDLDATEVMLTKAYDSLLGVKVDVLNYFGLDISNINKSLPTVIAIGLGAQRATFPDRHFEWYPNLIVNNQRLKEWVIAEKFIKEDIEFELCGVPHKIGRGGIHGALKTCYYPRGLHIDVKGYYSLIMKKYGLFSRALRGGGEEKYWGMYEERLRRKRMKDPTANSLKIGILAVWGATRNEFQLLFDETTGYMISITGQIFIVDLLERLEPYIELIQSNTDGIFVYPKDEAMVRKITQEWVDRTGFEVDIEEFTELYQKDVNNYICYVEGHLVTKGSFATSYGVTNVFEYGAFFKYHAAIVDQAFVDYLLHDKPIEETVYGCNDPHKFMMAAIKGPTYTHCEIHTTYPDGTSKVERTQDINRVFASNDDSCVVEIKKVKTVEKLEEKYCPLDEEGNAIMWTPPRARTPRPKVEGDITYVPSLSKIAGLPDNVFVFNGDLKEFDMHHQIDKAWYVRETERRLEMFLGA